MESTTASGDELEQLRDIVGPELSRRRLRDLLERSEGSVQRAIDLHFSAADSGLPEQSTLDQDAGPSTSVLPRPTRRAAMGDAASPRHLIDFVELSSSTDNDFDPNASDDSDAGINAEPSQSEEDDNTVPNPPPPPHKRCDIKDWATVDFNIMRDAALRKGLLSIPRNQLPLAKYRPRGGRLTCSNADVIPGKTAVDLQYPIHLGTLKLPLLEVKPGYNSAAAQADCRCAFVMMDAHRFTPWHSPKGLPNVGQSSVNTGIKISSQGEYVATAGGDRSRQTSLGRLCHHLAELIEVVHIQLAARLVPGPAHPELIKAAAQPKSHKMPRLHAEVDILLMEEAVLVGWEGLQELTEGKKKGRKSRGGTSGGNKRDNTAHSWMATARHMAPVLNWLMLADSGLQFGPDCDGLLNFCDEESSKVMDRSAAEGSNGPEVGRAQQGPSDGIADGQQGTADGQLGPAEGQLGTADGQLGTADGHLGTADGQVGTVDGQMGTVDGQLCTAEGQLGIAEGRVNAGPGVSSAGRAPMTVQQMLDSVALPDDAPTAVAPKCLRTVPKQFQLQGLQWMLARERQGDALGR